MDVTEDEYKENLETTDSDHFTVRYGTEHKIMRQRIIDIKKLLLFNIKSPNSD
jgi:hypothetical protein